MTLPVKYSIDALVGLSYKTVLISLGKGIIALAGNDRQQIDIVNAVAAGVGIHSVSILVHAQTQPAPDLLPLGRGAVRVLQSADLKYIRVIPALSQSGVGKDEPRRLLKAKEPFFVLQDQVISGNIVGKLRAALQLAVDASACLLINAEIPVMYSGYVAAGGLQIRLIGSIEHLFIVVQDAEIFLLEHPSVFTQDFIAVFIILAVLGNFVYEEKG